MRRLAALAALLALAFAHPAEAAIGTPAQVGAGHGYGVTSLAITVTGVTAGNFVYVAISSDSGWSSLTCSDNAASTWVRLGPFSGPGSGKNWLCYTANALSGMATVTLGGGAAASKIAGAVSQVSGVASVSPVDVTGASNVNGNAANSGAGQAITTTNANDLLVGVLALNGQVTSPASTGFTFQAGDPGAAGNHGVFEAYQIVSSTGTYTFAPTWTTATFYGVNLYSFKAAGGGVTPTAAGLLLGVGE